MAVWRVVLMEVLDGALVRPIATAEDLGRLLRALGLPSPILVSEGIVMALGVTGEGGRVDLAVEPQEPPSADDRLLGHRGRLRE